MLPLVQFFMASKSAKIGGGILAGGSTLALLLSVMGTRLDELNIKIDDKDKTIREYVDFKHDIVMRELRFMNDTQVDIKDTLRAINNRMYDERHQNKRGN